VKEVSAGGRRARGALSYGEWTDLLSEHFFRPEYAQTPVTFFVDDDVLDSLESSRDPGAGVASLASAVGSRVRPDSYGQRLSSIERESLLWKEDGGNGAPPALPLLAVAVLAATQMGGADGLPTNDYWKRFQNIVGIESISGSDRAVFRVLWGHLTWWLDDRLGGELGLSTVREHHWFTNIGYALSQALFRESDRRRLTEFFQKIDLEPGEELPPLEMLAYFRAWVSSSSLSPNVQTMATDDRYADWLSGVLAEEAAHWDGTVRDERGRRVGRLALALETFPAPSYWLAAQKPDSFPESATFSANGTTLHAETDAGGWYEEKLRLEPGWLSGGLRLEFEDFVLAYKPSDVVVLGEDDELGCWVSVTRVEPGKDYRVLARAELVSEVHDFLAEWDIDGEWHETDAPGAVPAGWTMFTEVGIRPVTPGAEVPSVLKALIPTARERLSFDGGLALRRDLNLYLQGGEPDLWLPSLLEEDEIPVSVGGKVLQAVPGQRLELRELRLPAGTYEVRAGPGAPLHFTTVATLGEFEGEGTGTLGFPIDRTSSHRVAAAAGATAISPGGTERIWVSGATIGGDQAALPEAAEPLVLPLRAREYILLGARAGEIWRPREPKGRAPWMADVGGKGLFPYCFEVYPRFTPVWVIVERESGKQIRLRHDLPPMPEPAPGVAAEAVEDWCRVLERTDPVDTEEAEPRRLWEQYQTVAREIAEKPPLATRSPGGA
jgi:hypothetical protein